MFWQGFRPCSQKSAEESGIQRWKRESGAVCSYHNMPKKNKADKKFSNKQLFCKHRHQDTELCKETEIGSWTLPHRVGQIGPSDHGAYCQWLPSALEGVRNLELNIMSAPLQGRFSTEFSLQQLAYLEAEWLIRNSGFSYSSVLCSMAPSFSYAMFAENFL